MNKYFVTLALSIFLIVGCETTQNKSTVEQNDLSEQDKIQEEIRKKAKIEKELEESTYITEFVSTGPKSHAYRDNKNSQIIKFKGISKTLFNVQKINLETMVKCVSDASFRVSSFDGPRNMLFRIDKFGRVKTEFQMKTFRMVYSKRFIGERYITYPFGYHAN